MALTHILIICGLISLPPTLVNTAYVVGQKIVDNPSDPMKAVIPILYGLQWGTWCITLVCLASLRLATRDPIVTLEVQDPKRPHSLETSRSQSSLSSNPRMNQHLFNFRQSVISPHGRATNRSGSMIHGAESGSSSISRSGSGGEGNSVSKMYKGNDSFVQRPSNNVEAPHAPERAWIGMERRSSSDSNAIYFANDSRISQVVVTFRDEAKDNYDHHTPAQIQYRSTSIPHPSKSPEAKLLNNQPVQEVTTIYTAGSDYNPSTEEGPSSGDKFKNKKDVFMLKFSPSGESLSDMIFKASEDKSQSPKSTYMNSARLSDQAGMDPESLSSQYRPKHDIPNPARIRATTTKTSLTLSSDSSSSEFSAVSNASSSECENMEQEEETVNNISKANSEESVAQEIAIAGLAMISTASLNVTSSDEIKAQTNSIDTQLLEGAQVTSQGYAIELSDVAKSAVNTIIGEHSPEDLSAHTRYGCAEEPNEFPPQTQPNSSNSSPSLSSLSSSSSSSRSRREDNSEVTARHSHSRGKPILPGEFEDITVSEGQAMTPLEPFSSPPVMSSSPRTELISILPPSPTSAQFPIPATRTMIPTTNTASYIPVSRSKSSIVSSPLQYWRNRSASHGTESSGPPTSPFHQSYITSTFSKKKKPIIPTIVLHPDEDDGEPPRVLSQKDIDYLSTMPPAPLRLLVQPWDGSAEDDEYDDRVVNEGYDYDEYHHPHHREHFDHDIEGEEFSDVDMDERGGFNEYGLEGSGEFDPYALDAPIDLDANMRELDCDNVKSRYGYI
ncbi:hypothetical protein BGX27_002324 [Mortierella sp. AM989]|nr:hypothetical protein BGX27_002324 [Mortierella sp. AM989]